MICQVWLFSFGLISVIFSDYTACCIIFFDIVPCNQASSSQWSRRPWWNLMVRTLALQLLTAMSGLCPLFFFKKNDLLWYQFQVHLSRSLHQCEMSGPSRTDTSALVRRYEIARDDHMLVQGPIQFKLIYLLTFLTTLTGPIQFSGPGSDDSNHTLMLELGAQA